MIVYLFYQNMNDNLLPGTLQSAFQGLLNRKEENYSCMKLYNAFVSYASGNGL